MFTIAFWLFFSFINLFLFIILFEKYGKETILEEEKYIFSFIFFLYGPLTIVLFVLGLMIFLCGLIYKKLYDSIHKLISK